MIIVKHIFLILLVSVVCILNKNEKQKVCNNNDNKKKFVNINQTAEMTGLICMLV